MPSPRTSRTVVLVEGPSDQAAVAEVARRLGYDMGAVAIASMGGATNIRRFLDESLTNSDRIAGLCDAAEERIYMRAFRDAGLGELRNRGDLEQLGFFVCEPDLEAELIRAVGVEGVLAIVADERDDLRRFRSLQGQPEWRDRHVSEQLRRWFGSGGSRKVRYAALLAGELDEARAPRPLTALLDYATGRNGATR